MVQDHLILEWKELKVNYNFTIGVRQALAMARVEAMRLKHDYVGTEHILLGLLRSKENRGRMTLDELSVDIEQLKVQLEDAVRPGKATIGLGEVPYTSRAKKVLDFSISEARRRRAKEVSTEHLLLGLLREEKGIAAEVLGKFGVTLDRARESGSEAPEPISPSFRVQIDDRSERSIYEQIVEQITEAVATGALRPGERLPTVRQLADDADIAPGTVARAYSELESKGVVVTEGARGTRVAKRAEVGADAPDREAMLAGLLRPVAVAAFHLGAGAKELRAALEEAMRGIFDKDQAPG
jgi:DNA-binding transcriptional regulator YhcF (GntR family)